MSQDFSNLQAGGHQPGITGSEAFFEVQSTGSAEQANKVTGQPTKDSIEKAAAIVASLYLPPMSNPLLIPPDPTLAMAIGQLAMDKICLSILDSWSENLAKIAEEKKAQDLRDEMNPVWREIHLASAIILSVATIFIRAIFGTQVTEALQKSEGLTDEKAIANHFAVQLNRWALEGVLNGYLLTIVDKLPSAARLNEAQKTTLANQLQIMLLASALAGIYKIQTKWITSEEFINLLANPGILNDPQAAILAMLIVNTLALLPEEARSRMTRTLTIYMDTNPNLPTLFDLGKTAEVQMSILNSSRT